MMMMVEVIMMIVVVVLVHLLLDQPVFFQVKIQETVWNSWLGYSWCQWLFLFECCIHNRLARRMQIQEPMVLLLLGEASWCKFLLGGRPPDAVDLMFFLCCCLHEYYDWPPSAWSLSFTITNTLIIQKPPVHSCYKPLENHINMLQNVCQYFLSTAKYLPYTAYECGNDIDLRRHLHKLLMLRGPTM